MVLESLQAWIVVDLLIYFILYRQDSVRPKVTGGGDQVWLEYVALTEMGMEVDLHGFDYTGAAKQAVFADDMRCT